MKKVIVIAELNPLHNGHAHLFEEIKTRRGAKWLIVIMSGSFVQRGEPALMDKHRRAASALSAGADLVIELPLIYSLSPAEIFARGAVLTANTIAADGELVFGSESGDMDALLALAAHIDDPARKWRSYLTQYTRLGMTYPAAVEKALSIDGSDSADLNSLLKNPNDMLGVEYLRSLRLTGSGLSPVALKRVNGGNIAHASDIRKLTRSSYADASYLEAMSSLMPEFSFLELKQVLDSPRERLLYADDLSCVLGFKLATMSAADLCLFGDFNNDLANRAAALKNKFQSFGQFAPLVKNKAITLARVRRCLTQLTLGIERSLRDKALATGSTFIRVLGFKKSAQALLGEAGTHASDLGVPMIVRGNDFKSGLITGDPILREMLRVNLVADSYYEQLRLSDGRLPEEAKPPIKFL